MQFMDHNLYQSIMTMNRNSHRVMKLAALAMFLCAEPTFATQTYAQSAKVTVVSQQTTVGNVISEIEKQTDYLFIYNESDVDLSRNVSVNKKDKSVSEVLDKVLDGTGLSYAIEGKNIMLRKQGARSQAVQQDKVVKGNVVDSNGEAIIGANVVLLGTTNGTITDIDGNFVLNDIKKGDIIEISFIGYKSLKLTYNGGTIKATLKEDSKALEEIVVVGYGAQKKVNLTGSVASVSTKDLKDRVQPNVLSAVQGTVPGVTVISRPGQTPSINFRGRGNLGSSSPLYVIDGAIADASFFSNLDPNSIESISFLKDAASSSIYGSRAAYGVVLVTTKQGKKEKLNVAYNGYVGVKTPTYLPDMLDSWDYANLLKDVA